MIPERPDESGFYVPLRLLRAQLRRILPEGTQTVMLQWSRQESRASRDADGWLCVGTLHALGRSWGCWWHPARRAWGNRELREISQTAPADTANCARPAPGGL